MKKILTGFFLITSIAFGYDCQGLEKDIEILKITTRETSASLTLFKNYPCEFTCEILEEKNKKFGDVVEHIILEHSKDTSDHINDALVQCQTLHIDTKAFIKKVKNGIHHSQDDII